MRPNLAYGQCCVEIFHCNRIFYLSMFFVPFITLIKQDDYLMINLLYVQLVQEGKTAL